jgi:hypothetical protein
MATKYGSSLGGMAYRSGPSSVALSLLPFVSWNSQVGLSPSRWTAGHSSAAISSRRRPAS